LSTKIEVNLFENLKVVFLHKLNIGDRTIWLSVDEINVIFVWAYYA